MSPRKPFIPRPLKSLGQNFLIDPNIKRRIIQACNLQSQDIVLEIGAGMGVLTEELINKAARVYAVETDRRLVKELQERFTKDVLHLVHVDFLKFDLTALPEDMKVVGNLPYHISTPIIERLLAYRQHFSHCYLTVQWEFGKRLAAKPNSKDYGSLSCFIQYHADVQILFKIKNTCFRPIPKVTSCFLKITRRPPLLKAHSEDACFRIIRQAFAQRRKKIVNALGDFVGKEKLVRVLKEKKLDGNKRAENWTLDQYVTLANALGEAKF